MSVQTPPLRPHPPEIPPHHPPPKSRWARIAIVLVALLLLGGLALAFIAPHWPYSEHVLIPAMEEAFKTKVTFQRFHRYYFPHPGCVAESVSLTLPQNIEGDHTIVTIQRIAITGRYSDLIFDPRHFAHIRLDGLYVRIPPRSGLRPYNNPQPENVSQLSDVSLGSVTAHDAVLEFQNQSHADPLKFEIHNLRVENIAAGKPMSYEVSMGLSEPPGEVESQGTFGPWQSSDAGKIPLHGTVKLTDAQLDKYHGIGGALQSNDTFSGTLQQIYVEGDAYSPDFLLKTAKHPAPLATQFKVVVDALKGEVQLKDVSAKIGRTTAHVTGSVEKNPARDQRETSVDFTIQRGRAEDLLLLFSDDPKPVMMGTAVCSGHVRVPQFSPEFLKNLEVKGHFEVHDGHFQNKTQLKTNELSVRASGKKVKDPNDAPEVSVASLASDVTIEKAVANFPNLFFEIPNARARMHGTYNFLKHDVDLHGNLWTQAKISQDTSGIKAALLKPLDPLFKRKHAGARIPVVMDGRINSPHFGTDIVAQK
jgi:hypothetical protein